MQWEGGTMKDIRTRRKLKVIGTETYINQQTGEIQEMQVINIEERDANFHKIWLGHIVQALDMLGNKKIKVLNYILQNLTEENLFIMTQRQLAKKLEVSLDTVISAIRILQEAKFLKLIQSGVYRISPDAIFKGGKTNRLNVLYKYNNELKREENKEDE